MAHADRDRWQATLARLHDLAQRGELMPGHIALAGEGLGVKPRTVRRRLDAFDPGTPLARRGPDPYLLSRADLDAYAFYRGNIAFVHRAREGVLDGTNQVAGGPVPEFLIAGWSDAVPVALRSLQRAFAEQTSPAYRALMTIGEAGRRAHEVHEDGPSPPRNVVWEMDHKDLPILVLPPRGKARRPILTSVIDVATRNILGWCLSVRPTQAHVLTALRMALVHEPERGPYGAVPALVRRDGGLEFAAAAVREALLALSVVCDVLPPYDPEGKGRIERIHRTIEQTLLKGLPGYTDGPRDAAGRLYGPVKDDPRSREQAASAPVGPMRLERFANRFGGWVDWYNTQRPHRRLDGRTPLQAWNDDDAVLRRVPTETLRHLLLAGESRIVEKNGIQFNNLHYIAPQIDGKVGERVDIRFMPHDDRWIEVYLRGEHLCTAHPQGQLTDEQTKAFREHKREEANALRREASRAERHAREVLAPINSDQPDAQDTRLISSHTASRLAQPPRQRASRFLSAEASTSLLGLREPAARPTTGTGGAETPSLSCDADAESS